MKKKLDRYVDGFSNNTVYQFHGCFYHGCPNCFHTYDYNPVTNEKYCNPYSRTKKFTYRLERAGYNVIFWKKKQWIDNDENIFFHTLLEPRDALYGGRTSPACLFKEVTEKEKKNYIDPSSLYPFVQKSKTFPIGHPQIYIKDEHQQIDIKPMFGLVKCRILPPRNLYFPVLPIRYEKKLLFPLCYTCVSTTCLDVCTHDDDDDDEQCIIGT